MRFVFGDQFQEFFFAFKVLPTIIFISSLMSVLYYVGVMQFVVNCLAWLMQRTLGTSAAETLSATRQCVSGSNGSSAADSSLRFGHDIVGTERGDDWRFRDHLWWHPGLVCGNEDSCRASDDRVRHFRSREPRDRQADVPETGTPVTLGDVHLELEPAGANVIEAAANGAAEGMKLALNVAAMLIAFMALIAMADKGLFLLGNQFDQSWSLKGGLGYCFAPLAWLTGIESKDCVKAGELLGLKMALNEVIAYRELVNSQDHLSPRSFVILTYALCGFANFSSIAIQIGGLGSMAPDRKSDVARLGLRAMFGGTLACCLTACVAGAICKSREVNSGFMFRKLAVDMSNNDLLAQIVKSAQSAGMRHVDFQLASHCGRGFGDGSGSNRHLPG